jgi:hypothetical protein
VDDQGQEQLRLDAVKTIQVQVVAVGRFLMRVAAVNILLQPDMCAASAFPVNTSGASL